MRVHVLGGVAHHIAVSHDVQHGDIVVGVSQRGDVGQIDPKVLCEMADARTLVDADVHEVEPFVAGACQIQAGAERGGEHLVEVLLAVPGGKVNRDLVRVDVEPLEGVDVGDGAVIDAHHVFMPAVALQYVCVVEGAKDGDAAGRLHGHGEDLSP